MEIIDPAFAVEYGDYCCDNIIAAEIKKSERQEVRKTERKIMGIINAF
jgi:hypothetical protein